MSPLKRLGDGEGRGDMINCKLIYLVVVLLAALDAGLSLAQEQDRARDLAEYRIGPEDVLDVAVWNSTAISRTVPVRPDGKISLPLLNEVQAAGLTPMELRDFLMKKLVDYIPTPEVSIIVREVHSFKVSVLGEVKTPGRYELKSRATVVDILAQAGGFSEFAARGRIVILRTEGGKMTRVPFNYNKVIGGDQENFFLQPGDVILVP